MPAFCMIWQVVSTLLVSGRFYLRARKRAGTFGLDDVMIFFGWLFSIGLTTGTYLSAKYYGLDRHTWDLQPSMYTGVALVSIPICQACINDHVADFVPRLDGSLKLCSSLAQSVPSFRYSYFTAV